MSYEIIYNAFSVKQGEAVIPYVISGSNNVYTMDYATGREVRARDLNLAWWLADNEYRSNVEAIKPYALSINRAELYKAWEDGGIQGLSLNSVIKRIERIKIDNSDGLIKTQINSLYYFNKTLQEEELLNALMKEFNNGINRILLMQINKSRLKNEW